MRARNLENRLLNYFLLIAAAAIMIGVEFYLEIMRPDLVTTICINNDVSQPGMIITGDNTSVPDGLLSLRNKIVVMFGLLTLVVAIVLTMFIRNITLPLSRMAEVAGHINQGDLSQVIEVETEDEIGELGIAINELTSNLQEIASLTSTTCSSVLARINAAHADTPGAASSLNDNLLDITSELQSLKEFTDSFKLLQARDS